MRFHSDPFASRRTHGNVPTVDPSGTTAGRRTLPASLVAELAAWTAQGRRARDAYVSDQAVREGLCSECLTRRVHGHGRRCWTCIQKRRTPPD